MCCNGLFYSPQIRLSLKNRAKNTRSLMEEPIINFLYLKGETTMDAKEIMTNDEVIETMEEIMETGTSKGFKIAAGVGLAVLAGGVAYKYIVKPIAAKIKSKKEQPMIYKINNQLEDDTESEED